MSEQTTDFQIDQKIVYPSQGVGKVINISKKNFKDTVLTYYVIYFEVSDMTVMVPVNRTMELGLRPIVPPEEAQRALNMISEEFEPIPSDWKLRYQMNLDLLKKGSIIDIATIVRSLYHRSKIKELPILERKLYDSAKKLLEDEISFSLDKSVKEVEALIHSYLEPHGAVTGTKNIVDKLILDEDEPDSHFSDDINDDDEDMDIDDE